MSTVTRPVGRTHALDGLCLQCPRCAGAVYLGPGDSYAFCYSCQFVMRQQGSIWRALPDDRLAYFSKFTREYEAIRNSEGRGSRSADYYLALPFRDTTGKNQDQWSIRAKTFRSLRQKVLTHIDQSNAGTPRILDIGAGNGWMSYRLARQGFRMTAVDLLVNDRDGLGAANHYRASLPQLFSRFQAESARLPFAAEQFDAVIFNASFHYAENYLETLGEALRCTRPNGLVIIADSPWYRREASGERMLAQRREAFIHRFGTASDSIPSREFLTDHRLSELERVFQIRWRSHTPFYGFRWALRPVVAALRRRREPSKFRIYYARKLA